MYVRFKMVDFVQNRSRESFFLKSTTIPNFFLVSELTEMLAN